MSRRLSSGLTLLEMLVVLMIAGMALALGFQSLGQWRRAETAISNLGAASREMVLTRDWLESSLRAFSPVKDAEFKGNAAGLNGITLQPLLTDQGGSTPVEWRVDNAGEGQLRLVVKEHEQELEMPLRGTDTAEFVYFDEKGLMHPQWPPALGMQDALPAAIGLRLHDHNGIERLWVAGIVGDRNPGYETFELEQD